MWEGGGFWTLSFAPGPPADEKGLGFCFGVLDGFFFHRGALGDFSELGRRGGFERKKEGGDKVLMDVYFLGFGIWIWCLRGWVWGRNKHGRQEKELRFLDGDGEGVGGFSSS